MVKPNAYGSLFDALEGEEQSYPDRRIACCPIETDFKGKVVVYNGQLMVPYETVEQLFVENEQLRETLYSKDTTDYNYAISTMINLTGHSTSDIIKCAERIQWYSKDTLKAKDVYGYIYSIMEQYYKISFIERRQDESKLQYCWRQGYLPIVSAYMFLFEVLVKQYSTIGSKELAEIHKKIIKKVKNNKKIK